MNFHQTNKRINMKRMLNELSLWIKWKIALWRAARALSARKREFPGCESALNAWVPTTGTGSLSSGYYATGAANVTTIRWGSKAAVTVIGGVSVGGVTVGVVLRFNESVMSDNIKLPQGDGLTCTDLDIIDGHKWDVTIRDDTGITARPTIGTNVTIADGGGLIDGSTFKYYTARVKQSAWDTAPKQAGEMTFSVERLTLVDTGAGA